MRVVGWFAFILTVVFGTALPAVRPAQAAITAPAPQAYIPPVITVWYGDDQVFTNGSPQNFINIVGNVNGGDPTHKWLGIQSLGYSLNGSPQRALTIGEPNTIRRRLIKAGDFNIDIALDDAYVIDGRNTVVITAVNRATPPQTASRTIYFTYDRDKTWELPYIVDMTTITNLQDAVQVVDGHWRIEGGGIRTVETGYDRVLAIGERTWTNYEVLVSFTLNGLDAWENIPAISVNPGIGVNLHWLGHTDSPVSCGQPKCGWEPTGASNWYEFWEESWRNQFMLLAEPPATTEPKTAMGLEIGGKYWLRARAESNAAGTLYHSKLWPDGASEPGWMLEKQTDATNLSHGSFLLVAHHVDVTYSYVAAIPLQSGKNGQTIQVTKHAPGVMLPGGTFTVSATATSGLPVTIASGSPDVCANQNGVFTVLRSGGTCIVHYSQPGNANYYPAPVVQELTQTGYNQYIPLIRK